MESRVGFDSFDLDFCIYNVWSFWVVLQFLECGNSDIIYVTEHLSCNSRGLRPVKVE